MKDFQQKIDRMVSKILSEEIEKKSDEMNEKLHGDQHKLDVAKPKGKLTKADFQKLGSKKKETNEFYFDNDESVPGDYEGDEYAEDNAEELSDQEPTYVGRGLQDNKPSKVFGSFSDDHGWFDENDRQYSGKFDFDYDEEEFDEFEPMFKKYGKSTKWYGPNDGKMFFDKYKEKFGGPMKVRMRKDMEEQETDEGNEFSGALADAREKGEDTFEVDGKTYPVKESVKKKETSEEKKWIQKTDMKKGALRKKLGIKDDEKIPQSKLKALKKELMKKSEGDKKLSKSDSTLLKQVNLALTLKDLKESKHTLKLTENELIDMIENIVLEQNTKNNIQIKTPIGLREVEKANKKTGQETSQQVKDVTKKLKEYLKDGSKEDFTMDPKHFPQGNGELDEKMTKKAYKASDAVEEYIQNFAYPGLENTKFDEIKPNDKWLEDNLVGSSKTGNNPEWANAVKTDVGEKFNKKRKANLYQKEKDRSYKRVAQPVDEAGEGDGEKALDSMFSKLESTEDKKSKMIKEDVSKMMNIIKYNSKTQ